ncbi:MAG: hypothetical protein COC12_02550 [Rhodobacteraceae bacterium]|nr:MAG: hypothetical protein COC12_02550 [Paracoccaceae bacterium]
MITTVGSSDTETYVCCVSASNATLSPPLFAQQSRCAPVFPLVPQVKLRKRLDLARETDRIRQEGQDPG